MSETRKETLKHLRRAIDEAQQGRSQSILVRGGIGIGKSWLLEQVVNGLDDGMRLLRATGHPTESDLPFAGLHELVAPLLHRLEELPTNRADALASALSLGTSQPGDRLAASAGLLNLIALEAETAPLIMIVDDLQWIDVSTRNALTFVSRRLDADAIVMISAERADAVPAPIRPGSGTLIELELLGEAESRDVLTSHFPGLGATTATRVLDQAGGLPLALAQIPADLNPEQRAGTAALPNPLPLGTELDRFYSARIAELGSAGRLALALASVEELSLPHLERALGLVDLNLHELDGAERAGLIEVTALGCRFTHSTVRSAAQQAATFDELRAARRAVLEVLPAGAPRAAHLDALATGTDAEAADALASAAREAWSRSAYEEAGTSWLAAARRSPEPSDRYAQQAQAVAAFVRCGAWASAKPILDGLVEASEDEEQEAGWRAAQLLVGLYSDEEPKTGERIDELARSLSAYAPHACARLLTTRAFVLLLAGELRAARAAVDALRTLLPGFEFSLLDALVLDDVDVLTGMPGAGRLLDSDWADSLTDTELCDPSFPIAPIVAHMIWIGHVDRAGAIVERQHEAILARGGVTLLELNLAQSASILAVLGRWDEAHAAFLSASELAQAMDFAAPLPHIALRHAYLLAARGDESRTRAILDSIATLPAATRPIHRHLMLCVEGLLELGLGRAELAAARLTEAAAIERECGMAEPAFFSRGGDLFDALWHLRLEQQALAELDSFETIAKVTGRHRTLAVVARCRAMAAPAAHIDAAFERAAKLHELGTDPFESARTQLAWGQRLRRERRRADARAPLHRALLTFETLGAEPWARTAVSELLACGERRATPDARGPARDLTPRELEVALEVARGSSNATTAARLFVSKKTVEYHLANVFRKLGVTSREQLSEALEQ